MALFLVLFTCTVLCPLAGLHRAARDNDVTKIDELVAAGASVEAQDNEMKTPLHGAAAYGNADAIKALVGAGASVEAQDTTKATPLHWAAVNGTADAIKALVAAGASLEAQDDEKMTPLHWAASKGHADAIKALVAAGASVEAQADGKATPLHLAAKMGHADAISILVAADPLRQWLRAHELSETEHLPVLQSLGVDRLADVRILCGLTMDELFSDIAWTSMPCAPRCSVVKVAVYKAINAECVPTKGGAKANPIEVKEEL